MITVTERAKKQLKAKLIVTGTDSCETLRLLPTSAGVFELILDTEMSGDLVVEYEGFRVLLIGLKYFEYLNGKTIDCIDTEAGSVLYVR